MTERPLSAARHARSATDRRLLLGIAVPALVIALALGTGAAKAESTGANSAVVEELLHKIDERDKAIAARDAAIDDLATRVQSLEREVGKLQAAAPAADGEPTARADVIVELLRRVELLERQRTQGFPAYQTVGGDGLAPPAPAFVEAVHKVAWPTVPQRRTRPVAEEGTGGSSEPGALDVDEDAAERALERSLTQSGALLLEAGRMEIEPSFQYLRRDDEGPLLVSVGADTVVAATRLRSDEFEGALDLRVGLPWDSQFEIGIPFRHVSFSAVSASSSSSGALSLAEAGDDATGFGDVRVGVAKTLVRENGWSPDLIARIEWDADTGQEENNLALGTGFNEITGSLVALKRQDPLAFTGQIAYRAALEDDGVDPGDELIFALGANLAASPSTSLSATLEQSFIGEAEVDGVSIPGSDQVVSTLTLGVSTVLDRGVLLTVEGGVGLTEESPDYFIGLSVPITLDVPSP